MKPKLHEAIAPFKPFTGRKDGYYDRISGAMVKHLKSKGWTVFQGSGEEMWRSSPAIHQALELLGYRIPTVEHVVCHWSEAIATMGLIKHEIMELEHACATSL